MKEITLTQGKIALIDDADFGEISQYKWLAHRPNRCNVWYARRHTKSSSGQQLTIVMHRQLLSAPPNMQVDHIDGNGLNNSRSNLRLCSRHENRLNSPSRKVGTSGFKGVSWNSKRELWQVQIGLDGKNIYLGHFADEIEAARVYDNAARELHGDFARTNFVESQG